MPDVKVPIVEPESPGGPDCGYPAESLLPGFAATTEFALLFIDAAGVINFINEAALTMFGYDRHEMIGRTLDLIIPQRLRGAHNAGVRRVGGGQPSKLSGRTVEVAALRRDGTEFPVELSLSVWSGPDGVTMGGMIRDISERRRREARLHRLAHQDLLTGLPNRIGFGERLQAALALGEPVGVLLLQLDGFKKITESLGHTTGDSLLQALAVRLPSAMDDAALLARFGDGEFAVLLPGAADPAMAEAAAASIVAALDEAFNIGGYMLKLGCFAGVAIGPADGVDADELIAAADLALYQARQDGRRVRLFEAAMRNAVSARRALQDELLRAVEAGELVLHYQPQVDLRTGAIFGAEALLRWNHPDREGRCCPSRFWRSSKPIPWRCMSDAGSWTRLAGRPRSGAPADVPGSG
ncbi:MAG: diguanylate cyclase [Pseudaminobacter sp.]|nr:diguanylate cyclase [Pseudaminobacter sp.]